MKKAIQARAHPAVPHSPQDAAQLANKPVEANYRFTAAANELNVRIALRQQLLAFYTTLVLGLLAALVALRPEPDGSHAPVEWLALGFPVASLCLVLLNIKTEHSLTHLRNFMSALEQVGNAHHHLPSYNADPSWAAGTNGMRRLHDYSAAILVAAAHAVGMGALWRIYPHEMGWQSPTMWVCGISGMAAVIALLWLERLRFRPRLRVHSIQAVARRLLAARMRTQKGTGRKTPWQISSKT
jgi:hypothetical protein